MTTVNQKLGQGHARVESRFLARMPDGSWETVWSHAETRDASKDRQETVDSIAQDPQIRRLREMIQTLGLDVDSNTFAAALRFGAATMDAQQAADAKFYEFRDRYLARLDGPPISWNKKQ